MPTYRYNGSTYDIPDDKVGAFEKKYPNATVSYSRNGDIFDIPLSKREAFLKKYPDAQLYIEQAQEASAPATTNDAPAAAGTPQSRERLSGESAGALAAGNIANAIRKQSPAPVVPEERTSAPAPEQMQPAQAQASEESAGAMAAGNVAASMMRRASAQPSAEPTQSAPSQEASPKDGNVANELESLYAELDKYKEPSDLVDEYERRLEEHSNTLDIGSKKNKENEEWLLKHKDAYRSAKDSDDMKEYARIKRRIYDLTVVPALGNVDANLDAINQEIRQLETGPLNKEKTERISILQDTKELYNQAGQELKKGSKYDEGYEKGWGQGAKTAIGQFAGTAAREVDRGTFTLGLSEGAAAIRARKVGEKYNGAIDAAKKELGYTDEDVNAIFQSLNDSSNELDRLASELEHDKSALDAMEMTYKDMEKSGASPAELNAYGKQYNQKVKEYNEKVKDKYNPLYEKYKDGKGKYDALMSAIDASVTNNLNDDERGLLDALDALVNARVLSEEFASKASKAGAGFEQTLEFMADFWLTKGFDKLGSKAATKIATERAIKKFGKEKVLEMAARGTIKPGLGLKMATDLGVSVARTAAMAPRNVQTLGEQVTQLDQTPYNGKDELGRYQFSRSFANAMANTGVQNLIEYWSEGFGEYFSAGEQALFRKVTKSAPKTVIGQTLKGYKGTVGRYLDYGKFDGFLNEMLEEVVGSGMNSLIGWMSGNRLGDKEALDEFKKGENLATMTLSFLPLTAIGAATNLGAYHQMRKRYDEGLAVLNPLVKSGAINEQDLRDLAEGIPEMTPEEITKSIEIIADNAREANGGRLPNNFAKALLGYLEGDYAMSLRHDEWEDSQEKLAIVNAYTENYANPNARFAWDYDHNLEAATRAAVEAGFTEEELEKDSYLIGQDAMVLRVDDWNRADVLMNYATAKAAVDGLASGYQEQTDKVAEAFDANVRRNLDMGGDVVSATLTQNDGTQKRVYVVDSDAIIKDDGTIATPTGDGVIKYRDTEEGDEVHTAKAGQFSQATDISTDEFIDRVNGDWRRQRDLRWQQAKQTVSPEGQMQAISENVGRNVVIDDESGVYLPVRIEQVTDGGMSVVISSEDKKALQGVAARMNRNVPPGKFLKADVTELYPLLKKEADGSLATMADEQMLKDVEEEKAAQEQAPVEQAPVRGLPQVKAGETRRIDFNGRPTDAVVKQVQGDRVWFAPLDENGEEDVPRDMRLLDFQNALLDVDGQAEEAPLQEPAPAPAQQEGSFPVNEETGEKIYDHPSVTPEAAFNEIMGESKPGSKDEANRVKAIARETAKAQADLAAAETAIATAQREKAMVDEWELPDDESLDAFEQRKNRARAEKDAEIAELERQIPELERKAAHWNAVSEMAKARTPEGREKEAAEAEEKKRESSRKRTAQRVASRARKWEKLTGVKATVLTTPEEVAAVSQNAAQAIADGEEVYGWYDQKSGKVYLYAPSFGADMTEVDKTYIHEVVSHKGLRGLLGQEGYDALCDRVWAELMTPEERKKWMRYNKHLSAKDYSPEYRRRAAADEYIANLSENLDSPENQSLFDRLVEWVKEILDRIMSGADIEKEAKEKVAGAETISKELLKELLADSMARYVSQTREGVADAETKREIGSNVGGAVETGENEKNSERFSMKSIVSGGGLSVIEDDGNGNVAFETADGRRYDAEHHITAEELKGLDNTVMGYMMRDARTHAGLNPELEARIWQAYADQLNAFLDKGVAKDGLSGADRLKALWQWEVENTVYKSVSTNGDAQYSYSIDITRVCKKNEATINAISAMQRRVGYGLTPGQIMDIYLSGIEEGYQVPCPVCYVFSRYIRNGIVATVAINGQKKWGKRLVDPSTLTEKQKQKKIQEWYDLLKEQERLNEENNKKITKAKADCTNIIEQIDTLSQLITSGRLTGKDREDAIRRVKALDAQYKAAFEVVSQSALTGWIKQFAIKEDKDGFRPEGSDKAYSLWEDTFQGFPEEYALDLRLTAETIEKYPAIQRLRNSRGSAGGKEIHFASNNDIGDIPMMLGSGNRDNYYQKAVKAQTKRERDKWLRQATKRFKGAHKYAQQQSLRGGQRMWSWSDNIERLGPDVFVNLLQLQMLGGALQAYSKQLEGVNLVATMGGYVNGSLMGYGKGWTELKPEDIAVMNGQEVLSHDIKDTVVEKTAEGEVKRERVLAQAGAPVFDIDGKKVTLLFDDVVGIDAYGRDKDGKHLKGLFDLNRELDKAGNILVGMNDTHVRAALADPRVFFVIPWHASGNSVHIVQQMLRYLGVDTDIKDYSDYTNVQEEKNMAKGEKAESKTDDSVASEEAISENGTIRPEIIDFWESHKNETDYPCGIEGGIPSGENGELSEGQKRYRELRNAIFVGVKVDTGRKTKDGKRIFETKSVREFPDMMAQIEADAFLSQALRKVEQTVDDKEMTNGDTKFIYPYEYWNEESTYDTADENGARYLEYCRRLGYKPKFVGKLDYNAKEDFGNFAGDKGYWKLLIDRRMYGVDGKFQDLTPTTTENYDPKLVDPEWTRQNFTETKVADDAGAERIAERAIEKERGTFGGVLPSANYDSNLEKAVAKYDALMAVAGKLGIKDLVAKAAPEQVMAPAVSAEAEEGHISFRKVEDQAKIDELESQPKKSGYRTVAKNEDGSFSSPMAGSLGRTKGSDKAKTSSFNLGEWEQSEENPDLADENGKIKLIKPKREGEKLTDIGKVDYNPYVHLRLDKINRQFKDAWKRDNLVYIESEVPESEVPDFRGGKDNTSSPYHADKAALPVGIHDWNGGALMLSRYDKPKREVPWEEVADDWASDEEFKKNGVHFDIVPPQMRDLLTERGIEIIEPHKGMGQDCIDAYNEWKSGKEGPEGGERFRRSGYTQEMESIKAKAREDGTFMKAPNGQPTNLDERQWLQVRTQAFKDWFGDWEKDPRSASKIVDENGEPMVMVHGSPAKFTVFRSGGPKGSSGRGMYFGKAPKDSGNWTYGGENGQKYLVFLNIRNLYEGTTIRERDKDGKTIPMDIVNAIIGATSYEQYLEDKGVLFADTPEWFQRKVDQIDEKTFNRIHDKYDGKGLFAADRQVVKHLFKKNEEYITLNPEFFGEIVVRDPNQIKSATENQGTFDAMNPDIRFRKSPVTPEQDAEYMDAVNAGDMEKAQQMVRDAFKAAYPDTKVVDRDGNPVINYRGGELFNVFVPDKASKMSMYGRAYYATPVYGEAAQYAMERTGNQDSVQSVFLDIRHPFVDNQVEEYGYPTVASVDEVKRLVDALEKKGLKDSRGIVAKYRNGEINSIIGYLSDSEFEGIQRGRFEFWHASEIVNETLKELGYDGVIGKFMGEYFYSAQAAAFYPSQIKSAEPVTYDDNGNVIPLSERFNPEKDDIRFRVDPDSQELFDAAEERFGTTYDVREAGYVLPDGKMLDFSGRHWTDPNSDTSWLNGGRQVDHRDIQDLNYEKDGNTPTGRKTDMSDFIRRGAIRISFPGVINLATKPTPKQASVLERLIRRDNRFVRVDFGDGNSSDHYADYDYSSASRIISDINGYFDDGIKPEGEVRFRKSPEEVRVEDAEDEYAGKTVDAMDTKIGTKVNRVARKDMPKGHETDKGWFDQKSGELYVCWDNVADERDAVATVIHETVGRKGLKELFGDSFRDDMVRTYAALDRDGRNWVNAYIQRNGLQPGDESIVRGMVEYMTAIAESGDADMAEEINDILGETVDLLFGTEGFEFTPNELTYILRASLEHMEDPAWLDTPAGRAKDTLWKRELGINESDRSKTVDPDAEAAAERYRLGETRTAKDEYEEAMKDWRTAFIMENQNADLPVRIGMEKVMKEIGRERLEEEEDYLLRHNLSSSRADTEAHDYLLQHFNPMLDVMKKVQARLTHGSKSRRARKDAYDRILDYLYAMSGLERNRWERDNGGEAKDWSGLTALTGHEKEEWQEAEADAQAMVDAFKAEVGDNALLDELWDAIRSCTDFSLDHALKYGLLTQEEYDRLHGNEEAGTERLWQYYLPLRGFDEKENSTAEHDYSYVNMMTVNPENNGVVKTAKGRWTKSENPLANMYNIALKEIVQGNENWARQALYRFAVNAGKNSLLTVKKPWYTRVEGTKSKWKLAEPLETDPNTGEPETMDAFEKRMQEAKKDGNARQGRRGLKLDQIVLSDAHKNQHLIRLKVAGEDAAIWVNGDPTLAKAVMGIGRGAKNNLWRRANRLVSNMFTTYSLDFTARNLIRDTYYSVIGMHMKESRKYRHRYYKNWIENFGYGGLAYPMIRMAAQWDSGELQRKENLSDREKMFIEFMHSGGKTGYTVMRSVEKLKKDIQRSMAPGILKQVKDATTVTINGVDVPLVGIYGFGVRTLNEAFELLTRFTAYQTSRQEGRSGERAAYDAKEISVNFNRRGAQSGLENGGIWGAIASFLGSTHYFYNAGVQGFDNFLRLYKASPGWMTAHSLALVTMGMVTPMLNSLLAGGGDGDDDWYWNLPEWVRRKNIVIGWKDKKGGASYIAIPLPVEFRALYGLGDIASAAYAYHNIKGESHGRYVRPTKANIIGDIFATAAEILPFNPVEGLTNTGDFVKTAARAVAPDLLTPIIDYWANEDYTGRKIQKEDFFHPAVPKSQLAYASTPRALVEVCQWMGEKYGKDVSPGMARNILNNFFGGYYKFFEDISKRMYTDVDRPKRWDDIPFLSGFSGHIDEDRMNTYVDNVLYDYKDLSYSDKEYSVVKQMNLRANTDTIDDKMAYEYPDDLPEKAKAWMATHQKEYNLGKIFYKGWNDSHSTEPITKIHKSGQHRGEEYETYPKGDVKIPGVKSLRKAWKDYRDAWAVAPEGTPEEKAYKAQLDSLVENAWHEYCDAAGKLADELMDYDYGN